MLAGEGLCPWEVPPCLSLQWDLVCEQKGLNKATSTFFFAGVLVGAVAFGYLSDRWGATREWVGNPPSLVGVMGLVYLCRGTFPLHTADPHDPCAGSGDAVCCWWPT